VLVNDIAVRCAPQWSRPMIGRRTADIRVEPFGLQKPQSSRPEIGLRTASASGSTRQRSRRNGADQRSVGERCPRRAPLTRGSGHQKFLVRGQFFPADGQFGSGCAASSSLTVCGGWDQKSGCRAGHGARAWRPCAPRPTCHWIELWCCGRGLRRLRRSRSLRVRGASLLAPRDHWVVGRRPGISHGR
jgi:hypothetical protein